MGARAFGGVKHESKRGLVLDRERFRYQKFCSDISGQDVRGHGSSIDGAINAVRNWLRSTPDATGIVFPGHSYIQRRYRSFKRQLPTQCDKSRLDYDDLHYKDYITLVVAWQKTHPR